MRSGIWGTERLSGIENMVSAHVGHAAEFLARRESAHMFMIGFLFL
jgi:hypothetical protein